jgi:hypothetical protein
MLKDGLILKNFLLSDEIKRRNSHEFADKPEVRIKNLSAEWPNVSF